MHAGAFVPCAVLHQVAHWDIDFVCPGNFHVESCMGVDACAHRIKLRDSSGRQSPLESVFKCVIVLLLYLYEPLDDQLNAELFGNTEMHVTAGCSIHLFDPFALRSPRIRASGGELRIGPSHVRRALGGCMFSARYFP